MNKINKKILNNVNLEQPSETVLCDAKNYMEKNKYKKKRMSWKTVTALSTACALIITLCICIPLLIPARQEFEFITNDQLTSTTVDSVAKYASKNNKNILTFNVVPISALVYSYSGDDVLAQEELFLDDFKIFFLVKIDTDRTRTYEKEELFYPVSAGEVYTTNINGKDVRHILYEGELYIQLQNNEYMYYLKFSSTQYVAWEETLQKLF
jgi:hypothetical protein